MSKGGANRVSLVEAQVNFTKLDTSDPNRSKNRRPMDGDERDSEWRPLDMSIDRVEAPAGGRETGETYSDDPADYYYWRQKNT
jgi:hypothetical protein